MSHQDPDSLTPKTQQAKKEGFYEFIYHNGETCWLKELNRPTRDEAQCVAVYVGARSNLVFTFKGGYFNVLPGEAPRVEKTLPDRLRTQAKALRNFGYQPGKYETANLMYEAATRIEELERKL